MELKNVSKRKQPDHREDKSGSPQWVLARKSHTQRLAFAVSKSKFVLVQRKYTSYLTPTPMNEIEEKKKEKRGKIQIEFTNLHRIKHEKDLTAYRP